MPPLFYLARIPSAGILVLPSPNHRLEEGVALLKLVSRYTPVLRDFSSKSAELRSTPALC